MLFFDFAESISIGRGAKDRLTSSWCTLGNVHFERQSSLSNKTAMSGQLLIVKHHAVLNK